MASMKLTVRLVVFLCFSLALCWKPTKQLSSIGLESLRCGNVDRDMSCCLCKQIVWKIQKKLDATESKFNIQVRFRVDEKKKIPYSRSEARVIEVLEEICRDMRDLIPRKHEDKTDAERVLRNVCDGFVEEYFEDLLQYFYNSFETPTERFCREVQEICVDEIPEENDDKFLDVTEESEIMDVIKDLDAVDLTAEGDDNSKESNDIKEETKEESRDEL